MPRERENLKHMAFDLKVYPVTGFKMALLDHFS